MTAFPSTGWRVVAPRGEAPPAAGLPGLTGADLVPYLRDESGYAGRAEAAFRPRSEAEVAWLLAEAGRRGLPLTVSAARTSLTGAAVPEGGWVLDPSFLGDSVSIDSARQRATAQSGAKLGAVIRAAQAQGLDFPVDPTSRDDCTAAGAVACNASGARSFRHGPMRPHVRRLRLVLPLGCVVELERVGAPWRLPAIWPIRGLDGARLADVPLAPWPPPAVKHAAGYHLAPEAEPIDLFIGQEGTLGVITELELALVPRPPEPIWVLSYLDADARLFEAVRALRADRDAGAPGTPEMVEYFDRAALGMLASAPRPLRSPAGARHGLLTAVLGPEAFEAHARRLADLGLELDDAIVAADAAAREALRLARHHVPAAINETLARRGLPKVASDLAVPAEALEDLWAAQAELLAGLESVVFGHIGDHHVHVNILPRDAAELVRARAAREELTRRAIALGGSFSGEHGVGKAKRAALALLAGEAGLSAMRAVKRALDPAGILCRGNLFQVV